MFLAPIARTLSLTRQCLAAATRIDAAGINPAAGRRQTGQGRENIVPYLFS